MSFSWLVLLIGINVHGFRFLLMFIYHKNSKNTWSLKSFISYSSHWISTSNIELDYNSSLVTVVESLIQSKMYWKHDMHSSARGLTSNYFCMCKSWGSVYRCKANKICPWFFLVQGCSWNNELLSWRFFALDLPIAFQLRSKIFEK